MRRTKTVCTIGPATETKTKINLMIKNGMDVARLNFSHGTHSWFAKTIHIIRQEAKKLNKPVAILQDLCGPKIRLGNFPVGGMEIKQGQKIIIAYKPDKELLAKNNLFDCSIDLSKYLNKGQIVLIDDGKAQLETVSISKKNATVAFISHSNHFVKNHKGVNLPYTPSDISSLTDKDIQDLIFGLNYQPEFIALSFVKNGNDIIKLKKILTKNKVKTKIIAKIETALALQNIDEIIASADGIMVARGDLGLETPIDELAIVQKMIIQKCIFTSKPVIVATQMLASMTHNPLPTRAEACDVANAVFDNTDAVMLSEESAVGNFPVKSVNTLAKICQTTDENLYIKENGFLAIPHTTQITSLATSACQTAINIDAKMIIIPSFSGSTARIIASHKPPIPIIACTNDTTLYNQLSLSWGITPALINTKKLSQLIPNTITRFTKSHQLKKGDKVVILVSSKLTHLEADQLHIKTI